MLYLLAAVGAIAAAVLLWKAFGPERGAESRPSLAPDDDPDFLRGLNRRRPGPEDDA